MSEATNADNVPFLVERDRTTIASNDRTVGGDVLARVVAVLSATCDAKESLDDLGCRRSRSTR